MEHLATPDRVARDHRHHGLWQPADLDLEIEHVESTDAALRDRVVADVPVVAADPLIASRAEGVRTLAGQDDHADVGIVARLTEGVGELEQRLGPERVAHLRPADGDLRDPLGDLEADVVIVAERFPRGRLEGPELADRVAG